jgi:DNA-binding MarR family transcriptional regulator
LVELVRLYSNREVETVRLRVALGATAVRRQAEGQERRRQYHRRLGPSDVAGLLAAYQAKEPVHKLAKRFGIHRVTVTALLKRHGNELRHAGLAPEQIPVAASLYRQGWSLAKLGDLLGADPSTVWRKLRAAGVRMRSPNQRHG